MNPSNSPDVCFASQNCNSLNVSTIKNQDLKISSLVSYKSDIIFVSDIRLNGKDYMVTEKLRMWYKLYFNSSKNSRGVGVLISHQVEHEILEQFNDLQENVILLRVKINEKEMIIGSVYGPNTDAGSGEFFDYIANILNRWRNCPTVIGGDWNATYSSLPVLENPDVMFMRQIPSRLRFERVNDLCEDMDLSDPFRILHPDDRDFTYNPSGSLRKNRSRIDYFLSLIHI